MKEHAYCHQSEGLDSRFTLKGTGATYAPDRTFDTEHIRLELEVDIQKERIRGRCFTRLRSLTDGAKEMTFDAVNFRIRKVKWNGELTSFSYKNEKIAIHRRTATKEGDIVNVEIDYEVTKPKLGIYFIKPNTFYPKRPTQVWTQGEDEYARYWFPCHDAPHERTTTEIVATVPRGYTAVSNGKLVRASGQTFHYLQDIPHATYLVTLTVGKFTLLRDKWRKVPILYYCEKGREADTRRAFGKTPKMMEFFSSFTGTAYPYAKYAQIAAADFIYGGMENTSATTQTDSALLDQRSALDYSSDELVAHELAHQWFGDYLTCKDWSHAWLNESFATYFDPLFKREDKGEDEFLYHLRGNADAYFQEDKEHYRRPIVTKNYRRPSDLFDRHLYEKGSLVLHMLHRLLGEDLFRKSIAAYVRKNKGQVVETLDLINAIEDATGRNLREFFDQWVFGAGHPEFKVRTWWDRTKKQLNVRITQTQAQSSETGLFSVATEIMVLTAKGERRFPIKINKKSHLFHFTLPSEPMLVLFDPDHALLKRVDFPKSEKALLIQLSKDKNVLGRIDAAYALAKRPSSTSLRALRKALLSDAFWGVRADVARALGSTRREEAAAILIHSLDVVDHPKVRRAVYSALRSFSSQAIAEDVAKRLPKEASYFAEAEALRVIGALNHPKAEDILKVALEKDSWNDILRVAALESLASMNGDNVLPTLLTYINQGHSHKLRLAAVRSLASFAQESDEVQTKLIKLTTDPFPLMQIAAVRILQQVGDERAVPALKALTQGDYDGRLKRLAEEAVEKITKGIE